MPKSINIYLSGSGNDSNSGTSELSPVRTIARAFAVASATYNEFDTVNLVFAAGTYPLERYVYYGLGQYLKLGISIRGNVSFTEANPGYCGFAAKALRLEIAGSVTLDCSSNVRMMGENICVRTMRNSNISNIRIGGFAYPYLNGSPALMQIYTDAYGQEQTITTLTLLNCYCIINTISGGKIGTIQGDDGMSVCAASPMITVSTWGSYVAKLT